MKTPDYALERAPCCESDQLHNEPQLVVTQQLQDFLCGPDIGELFVALSVLECRQIRAVWSVDTQGAQC